ncbi:MAG: hypothetical protein Q4D38_05835 [Planctomycetia bacterium]|nr:hypothetical protein [Planctomycetia bacterium]
MSMKKTYQAQKFSEAQQLIVKGLRIWRQNDPENDRAAFGFFSRAAELNDAVGQYMLGVCYDTGRGTMENIHEACRWYALASEQGLREATYNLGVCSFYGEGTAQDFMRAADLFCEAAGKGLLEATYNYALCFEFGLGVDESERLSQSLYTSIANEYEPAMSRVRDSSWGTAITLMTIGSLLIHMSGVGDLIRTTNQPSFSLFWAGIGAVLLWGGLQTLGGLLWHSYRSAFKIKDDPSLLLAKRLNNVSDLDFFAATTTDADNPAKWTWLVASPDATKREFLSALPDTPFGIDFSDTKVDDNMLMCLCGNTNLRAVSLLNCGRVSRKGIALLATCPELRSLVLGSKPKTTILYPLPILPKYRYATDEWLRIIAGMKQLENLQLIGCSEITNEGVAQLEALEQLQMLGLTGCDKVDDEGLRCLRGMVRLQNLELGSKNFHGTALSHLRDAVQLQSLTLFNPSRMDDRAFLELAELPLFRNLLLDTCYRMSPRQVARVKKLLPYCEVSSGPLTGYFLRQRLYYSVLIAVIVLVIFLIISA